MSKETNLGLAAVRAALAGSDGGNASLSASDIKSALGEARQEGLNAGLEAGKIEVAAERARIRGIMTCDEAKGREELAEHFAFSTAMTVDDAKAALSKSPKASNNLFIDRMASVDNPKIGSDNSEQLDGLLESDELAKRSAKRLAAQRGVKVN